MKIKRKHTVATIIGLLVLFSCSGRPSPVLQAVDTENNRLIVLAGKRAEPLIFYDADFVILGGGLGGIAAALSICSAGRTALLVEETDRIAGCFSYQDTSLYSENRFVESSGTSASYQTFRAKIREWYDGHSISPPMLVSDLFANMSDFSGDNFCFETEAALDVIDDMLARNVERGKLTIIKRHKVANIITFNNRIASLQAIDLDNLVCNQITGWMFVDATRDGYILPIVGIEHVTGTESRDETGEPHAPTAADTLMTTEFIFCPYKHPTEEGGQSEDCYVAELQTGTPQETEGMAIFPSGLRKRRIVPFTRIIEQDIAAEYNPGPRAKFYRDSVGIGYHPIVIPPGDGISPATIPTKPFQIPFGALVPIHFTNYLSGGMTIGATYVASRAYQAPSVEWAIGEAAGEAAAYCAGYQIYTHELLETPEHVRGLQDWLVTKRGVPLYWYDDVKPSDPDFAEAQLEPFDEPGKHESSASLHYRQ